MAKARDFKAGEKAVCELLKELEKDNRVVAKPGERNAYKYYLAQPA
jgi:hypothetical protein